MKILEGAIPAGEAWRVLILFSPDESLGRAFALGSALAHENHGQLVTAVFISEESQAILAACHTLVRQVEEACEPGKTCHSLIIQTNDFNRALKDLINKGGIDLVITRADATTRYDLSRIHCAVAAVRGDRAEIEGETAVSGKQELSRILVPTAGGPNAAYALTFLLPLTPQIEVTVLYVVAGNPDQGGERLGRERLRQLFDYVDASDRVQSKIVFSESIADAIVTEVNKGYDLVIIGASRENSLDKVLFGDIPGAVVRTSKRPVVVVRQPQKIAGDLSWKIREWLPRLSLAERTEAYVRIRRGARPDIDYYMLISLAAMIASLGLIANSAAVVIGAMLVAPLMSPIIGSGLAIVLGDARFLRLSTGAVFQGAVLAVLVGMLAGLAALNEPLAGEVLARTQPSLLDLGIALFSGLAAAYALCRSDAAGALPGVAIAAALVPPLTTVGITFTYALEGLFDSGGLPQAQMLSMNQFRLSLGALLLFATNFVAISSAAALMFLILGYRPGAARKDRKRIQTRAFRASIVLLILISLLLFFTTYQLAQGQRQEARIREVIAQQVQELARGELDELEIVAFADGFLELDLVVRSANPIPYFVVQNLQESIGGILSGEDIIDEIALTLTVIRVTELDPLSPPTSTPTSTPSETPLPSLMMLPSATPTLTPIPTDTPQPTATLAPTETPVPTETPTLPAPTETPSPTPVTAVVNYPYGLNLRAEPDTTGELLAVLDNGVVVVLLPEQREADSLIWQRIQADGMTGWVAAQYLAP
ncbi:MAG: DUF389 domain-containing protein [Chloroflexota bacterium]